MKLFLYGLAFLAFMPAALAISLLARSVRSAKPVHYPYDDDDPGVDVDATPIDLDGVPDQATLEALGYNDAVEFLEYRERSKRWS